MGRIGFRWVDAVSLLCFFAFHGLRTNEHRRREKYQNDGWPAGDCRKRQPGKEGRNTAEKRTTRRTAEGEIVQRTTTTTILAFPLT